MMAKYTMPAAWKAAALVISCLVGTACQPEYGELAIELRSTPPLPLSVGVYGDQIDLPAGFAVEIFAFPLSDNQEEYDAGAHLELRSDRRDMFLVHQGRKDFSFVLVGISVGNTCLRVYVDGEREACIPVRVTEPVG